jgi:hypothetical protein
VTGLDDLLQAAIGAPTERREAALRILRGELPKSEPYLTLRELSQRLGFCTTTLRRWRVPGHAISGARRYRVAEVEAYFTTEEFRRRKAAVRAERRQSAPTLPQRFGSSRRRTRCLANQISSGN